MTDLSRQTVSETGQMPGEQRWLSSFFCASGFLFWSRKTTSRLFSRMPLDLLVPNLDFPPRSLALLSFRHIYHKLTYRPPLHQLQERQGPHWDVGHSGASPDPLQGVRPGRARIPEGNRRHEEVNHSFAACNQFAEKSCKRCLPSFPTRLF